MACDHTFTFDNDGTLRCVKCSLTCEYKSETPTLSDHIKKFVNETRSEVEEIKKDLRIAELEKLVLELLNKLDPEVLIKEQNTVVQGLKLLGYSKSQIDLYLAGEILFGGKYE